jgi:DNA sulfur modification protein DndB
MSEFEMILPAVKGLQARREYYLSAIPLRHILQVFGDYGSDSTTGPPARPTVNKQRVRELVRYILENPAQYALPPLIACVDARVQFERSTHDVGVNIGYLRIPMDAMFSVKDGQHWIAAVEAVLAANSELANETVAAVLIPDVGLKRCRQVFADLARYAIRAPASLTLLDDQRDEAAQLAKNVMSAVPFFAELTETQKSSISNRSTKLFTLSAIHGAVQTLVAGLEIKSLEERTRVAAEFWIEVGQRIPAWRLAKEHTVATADLRREYIHAHALALAAIARAGNQLLARFPRNWKAKLKKLSTLDWSRNNTVQWEGRAMNAGRLSKRSANVTLSGNLVKQHLGLPLSPDEEALEREFRKTRKARNGKVNRL